MSKNSGQLTHLSLATTITGEVVVENDIRVAGTVKGKLTTSGQLIVEQSGVLEAEIKVNSATIAGKIMGNIEATDRIVLESKAELTGDIKTKQLIIEDGAIFQGNCIMNGTKKGEIKGSSSL